MLNNVAKWLNIDLVVAGSLIIYPNNGSTEAGKRDTVF